MAEVVVVHCSSNFSDASVARVDVMAVSNFTFTAHTGVNLTAVPCGLWASLGLK